MCLSLSPENVFIRSARHLNLAATPSKLPAESQAKTLGITPGNGWTAKDQWQEQPQGR